MSTSQRYVVYMPYDSYSAAYAFTMQEDARVQDLIQAIRNHPDFIHLVKNDLIMLFKCDLPVGTPVERVSEWLRTHAESALMEPAFRLSNSEYFPDGAAPEKDEKIDVLVTTRAMLADLHAPPSSELAPLDRSLESIRYSDMVTFKMRSKGTDPTKPIPTWDDVILLNNYKHQSQLAQFAAGVVRKRRRAANNNRESANHLLQCFKSMLDDSSHEPIVDDLLTEDIGAAPYVYGNWEMTHYIRALTMTPVLVERRTTDTLKIDQVNFVVLDWFKYYWPEEVEGGHCTSPTNFPFLLIAELQNEAAESAQSHRQYQPRPDFALLKRDFPWFLVEVDSSSNQNDKPRLQVQMACALRLAVALQDAGIEVKQFFLMGAFFARDWKIFRYFFYIQEREIRYHEEIFDMKNSIRLTTFLFEFYNYVRHVKDDSSLDNKKGEIAKLVQDIKHQEFPSLYSYSEPTKSGKRPQPGEGGDDTNDRADQGASKHVRTAMASALEESGFKVIDQYFDDFAPLVELPAHVVEGTGPDGEHIIAKLPRKNSDELPLLHMLSSLKSPHNHAIPLLDIVQSSLGPLIILPWATSLAHPIEFEYVLKGKVVQLSRELVEGVAFLHRQKIAHLDIKPGNLVYNFKHKRLYIIDFDLAMQCKDVEEMVRMSCGTPGWSAPEIGYDDDDDDKPFRTFSPIRADLWSCGKVLRSFVEVANQTDEDISTLANLLMDFEPSRRPLLHEIVDEGPDVWTSGRLHQALVSHINDQTQREMTEGVVKSKRARDDAGGEGFARARKLARASQ